MVGRFYDIKRPKRRAVNDSAKLNRKDFRYDYKSKKLKHRVINFDLSGKYFYQAVKKSILVTSLLLVLLIFSFARVYATKGEVEKLVANAQIHLENSIEAIDRGDLGQATEEANKASIDVKKIKLNVQAWGQDVKYLDMMNSKKSKAVDIERMLNGIEQIVSGVTDLKDGTKDVFGGILSDQNNLDEASLLIDINSRAGKFSQIYTQSDLKINSGLEYLKRVDTDFLQKQGVDILGIERKISKLRNSLKRSNQVISKDLLWLSASSGGERKILIVFQNNAELRGGSGGSLGSFGVAKFKEGKFLGVEFGQNIYKLDQAFKLQEKVAPPENLSWIVGDGYWVLKDAGWAVDGALALQKIEWFYETESGQLIDGVMVIDTTAFLEMLDFSGSIDLPEYQKTITAENFRQEIEYEVHKDYFGREGGKEENEPKKILADIMPKFINQLFQNLNSETKIFDFLALTSTLLKQRDILLYFEDEDFQQRISDYNYSGQVKKGEGDYLYINNSNLAGEKSSLSVIQEVKIFSNLTSEGKVVNQLNLKRTHRGEDVWPDGLNRNFTRVVLPNQYEILSFNPRQGNFQEFYDQGYKNGQKFWKEKENENEMLNFWINTQPGGQSEVNIEYTFVPQVNTGGDFVFPVKFQKQPGALADKITYRLKYPEGFIPENVKGVDKLNRVIKFEFELDQDQEFLIKFKKVKK